MIKANRILAEARRDELRAQNEQGETGGMETATDDVHEPIAEDLEVWEEPNQCMDEEMEDPFNHLLHDIDEDLTMTPCATEHSVPNVPPSGGTHASSSTAPCCIAETQQRIAARASACGSRI